MLPIPRRRPHNLHISRHSAVLIAVLGVVAGGVIIVAFVSIYGLSEGSTPIVVSVAGALATAVPSLISALKSTESADSASKARDTAEAARQVSELTASQTASLQMTVNAHCGQICPARYCPLRPPEPAEVPNC